MKTKALLLSVTVNIGLIAYLIFFMPPEPITPAAAGDTRTTALNSPAAGSRPDASVLRQRLLTLGMSDESIKPVVLAYVAAAVSSSENGRTYEYWREAHAADAQFEAAEERRVAMENALLETYGDSARDDPAFRTVFKPLQDRFPFLSSEQQITLRRLQTERRSARSTAPAPPPSASLRGGPPSRPKPSAYEMGLRQLMPDASTYLEYAMRESPLADRIRASGVEFSESEYRDVFKLMSDFQSHPTPSAFVAQREALRDTLGRDRALRFWAATDPLFAALRDVSARHDLREETMLSAYELLADAQEDLLVLGSDEPDARRGEEIRERIERRDRMLRELLGEAAANAVMQGQRTRLSALGATSP